MLRIWGKAVLICTAFIVLSVPALASDCFDKTNEPDELTACTQQALEAANATYAQSYHALADKTSQQGRMKLRQAWATWLSYREAQCTFDASGSENTPIHQAVLNDCLEQLTIEQTAHINAQVSCAGGDSTCGGQ